MEGHSGGEMIEGRVNAALDAVVRLSIRGPSGETREVEAVIDTGYNGFLTLPPALVMELGLPLFDRVWAFLADGSEARFNVHTVFVEWDGRRRYVKADATGKKALIGMELLHRHSLYVEVAEGGRVAIQPQE